MSEPKDYTFEFMTKLVEKGDAKGSVGWVMLVDPEGAYMRAKDVALLLEGYSEQAQNEVGRLGTLILCAPNSDRCEELLQETTELTGLEKGFKLVGMLLRQMAEDVEEGGVVTIVTP